MMLNRKSNRCSNEYISYIKIYSYRSCSMLISDISLQNSTFNLTLATMIDKPLYNIKTKGTLLITLRGIRTKSQNCKRKFFWKCQRIDNRLLIAKQRFH